MKAFYRKLIGFDYRPEHDKLEHGINLIQKRLWKLSKKVSTTVSNYVISSLICIKEKFLPGLLPHQKHCIAKQHFTTLPKQPEQRVFGKIYNAAFAFLLHTEHHGIFQFRFKFTAYKASRISRFFNNAYIPSIFQKSGYIGVAFKHIIIAWITKSQRVRSV